MALTAPGSNGDDPVHASQWKGLVIMLKRGLAAAFAMLCATMPGIASAQNTIPSPTLDAVRARGLAAAIFNDTAKVRFIPLSSSTRFTALGSGEIDVLFRTSTQTMLRDTTLGLRHVTTYFYDGHGFMVRANAGV